MNTLPNCFVCGVVAFLALQASADAMPIYFEDFTTSPPSRILDDNPSLGGSPVDEEHREVSFGEYAGAPFGANDTFSGDGLRVETTPGFVRGVGVVIDPLLFAAGGAGEYTVSFDTSSFLHDFGDNVNGGGHFSVWSGSGYSLGANTSNARLELDLQKVGGTGFVGVLPASGATATQLTSELFYGQSGAKSQVFNYDGTSAIVLVWGATAGQSYVIDNVLISMPEPAGNTLSFFGVLGIVGLCRRRRR